MAYTLTTSGAVLLKAGKNVSSDLINGTTSFGQTAEQALDNLIQKAEQNITALTRFDWIDNYASLSGDFKLVLNDCTACLAAIDCIKYDMSGYTSRAEATTIINILHDRAQQLLEQLKEDKVKKAIGVS